jgi:hypothetical protein
MDEKETIFEIQRLKLEIEKKRNDLLNSRGFFRSAEPQRSRDGAALWEALPPEEKEKYNQAAKGMGLPGSGLFFLGYRETKKDKVE